MQAAARLAEAFSRAGTGPSEKDSRVEEARRAGTDHEALLNALPIASAVIGRAVDKRLLLVSYNQKFADAVSASTCTAGIQAEEKACLQTGPIAELMQRFFDGEDSAEELEFRDGEGISARYFRIELAPLPARRKCDGPRCLLSLVDRTVEAQAERALRAGARGYIMKEAGAFGRRNVQTQFPRHQPAQMSHFDGMIQDVLGEAVTEAKASQ